MAGRENIFIRIITKAVGERDIDKVTRKLTRLGDVARGYGTRLESTLDTSNGKWKRHFDYVDKMVKGMGGALTKFVGMSAKLATVQVGALGVAMMGVHAAFVLGNATMKAFRYVAQLGAGAAAGLTIALSAAAAAMREQQAATYAYRGIGKSAFGAGINQVRVELRGLTSDAELASVGTENLMGAFAAISKKGVYTQGTQALFKGLMDFASAGQDIKTGSKAAGELVATLIDPKANFSKVTEAAKALGPQMEQALEQAKKKGITTTEGLKAAILDGSLAVLGGVEGQFDAFNGTLINQGKAAFAMLKEQFADFGQPFLAPLKAELFEVNQILRSAFVQITGDVSRFGQGTFIDNISVAVEKVANFMTDLLHDYLPKVDGMFSRMGEWWGEFKGGWNSILDTLRPLIDAAKVLEKMLLEVLRPVGDMIGDGFMELRDLIVDNETEFIAFGASIGNFIEQFGKYARTLREMFVEALPFLTKIVNGATALFEIFTGILGTVKKFTGALGDFGPFAMIAGLMSAGRGMKKTIGGELFTTKAMTVQAGTVQVHGPGSPSGGTGMRSTTNVPPGYLTPQQQAAWMRSQTGTGAPTGPAAPMGTGRVSPLAYARKMRQMTMSEAQLRAAGIDPATVKFGKGNGILGGLFNNAKNSNRARRSGYLGTRMFGGEFGGKTYKGFNNSTTGAMAASLGLGLLSNVAGPEAQGALALGSTVGMFNPMAGLAVGLGGSALTATTVGGGALAGAGAGATIGTMIAPGIGTAVGAVLGTVVGGLAGMFNGDRKKREAARKAGKDAMTRLMDGALEGMVENVNKMGAKALTTKEVSRQFSNLIAPVRQLGEEVINLQDQGLSNDQMKDYLRKQRAAGNILFTDMSDEDFEAALKKPKDFFKQIPEMALAFEEAQVLLENKYTSRLQKYTDISGQSEESIIKLADAVGINLMDASIETEEVIKKLASGMINSFRDMERSSSMAAGKMVAGLMQPFEAAEAGQQVQDISRNIYDQLIGGTATEASLGKAFGDLLPALTTAMGGDQTAALVEFATRFGRGGSAYSQANGPFSGMEDKIYALIGPQLDKAIGQGIGSVATSFQEYVVSNLMGQSLTLGEGQAERIGGAVRSGSLSMQEMAGIQNFVDNADMSLAANQQALDRMLSAATGIDIVISKFEDTVDTEAADLKGASESFSSAVQAFVSALDTHGFTVGGDTRTPRGIGDTGTNLSKTMASHSALSSNLPGKRIITSSYRNFALGSLKSDHLTGNALDLVGDNLVSYRDAINRSGGFAEFHGGLGDNRHLHVVPNVNGIGDTSMMMRTSGSPQGGSSSPVVVNNTFNISGVDGSRDELVQTIINRINTSVRDAKERR